MSNREPLTTLQVEKQTRDMLRKIAKIYERSMTAQIRVMVKAEYNKLQIAHSAQQDVQNHHQQQTSNMEENMSP
jgi:hypothetical protein